jgi:hypothetical protein
MEFALLAAMPEWKSLSLAFRPRMQWKILPLLAIFAGLATPCWAEPDPGFVDALGRRENALGKSIQYNLPDLGVLEDGEDLQPLLPPAQIRAIEPFRTVRRVLPDGRLLLHGGRTVALLGVTVPNPLSLSQLKAWENLDERLADKMVRLVFEKTTRNASGEMAAYLFLSNGRLLNEIVLREGMGVLDTAAELSPQYRLRFEKASRLAQSPEDPGIMPEKNTVPQDASRKTPDPEFSQYRNGFLGVPPGTDPPGWAKRSGENQSLGGGLFPRYRHQSSNTKKP